MQVGLLRQQLVHRDELLAVLRERLKLDSKNSSKPPSSDGPGSGGSRAQRRTSERKRGAQKGHKGSWRALLDESQVDHVFECKPVQVCDCGAAVVVLADEPVRHQVFDVPPVKARVDEYRRYCGRCLGCGKTHRAALPAGVPSGQIGPRALALIGTLGTHYHLTQFKIRDLLARLMGVDFSVGAIPSRERFAGARQGGAGAAGAAAGGGSARGRQAPVKQLDETRYPREGSGNWGGDAQGGVVQPVAFAGAHVATNLIGDKPCGTVVSDRYGRLRLHRSQAAAGLLGRVWTSSVLRTLDASRGVEPLAQRGLQGHLLRDLTRPQVPWRAMRGMRNRIAHGYFELNLDVVWDTLQTAFPDLARHLPALLADADPDPPDLPDG